MRPLLASFLLAAVAACNPYDPDLGDRPFRCGTDEPRCPEGYTCVEHSAADQFCERASGGDPDAPDAADGDDSSNITCNDDSSIEPNDTTSQATTTPIPSFNDCTSMVQLAVCPDTDIDLYRFGTVGTNTNVRATITTQVAQGELELQILNGTGTVTASGAQVSGTEIEVFQPNLSQGTWHVRVRSPEGSGIKNNYTLEIVTCTTVADCDQPCQ